MTSQLPARIALAAGNFVTGVATLGLAGMLIDLADGLHVSIPNAGLIVTAGAITLGIGAPLMVWATSRFDRRLTLAAMLALVALGYLASAALPAYAAVLGLRVLTMIAAAALVPIAAGTVALIVPAEERPGAVVFVFLGFSLAMAAGLPAVTFLSAHLGWQTTFVAIGIAAALAAALVFFILPAGVFGVPLSLRSWGVLARNRLVLLLLLLTTLQVSGQFVLFTYLGPLLHRLAGADSATIGVFFSLFGIMGFVGNLVAARLVLTLKAYFTSMLALLLILLGFSLWSLGAGTLIVMGIGVAVWGLGFTGINSMQQARLVAAAPDSSSAAVALNTSMIYIGQAIGSALGGVLFAHDLPRVLGYAAIVFCLAAIGVLVLTRRASTASTASS